MKKVTSKRLLYFLNISMTCYLPIVIMTVAFSCSSKEDTANAKDNIVLGEETDMVFFAFDEYNIPWKDNLHMTMVQPEKYANNPVLPRGDKGSVDEFGVQFYGSVIKDKGKFRLWYIAMDNESLPLILNSEKRKNYSGLRPAYAESEDGIHWYKPNLGLVEYRGNKNNNLVLIDPPEVAGIHLIVLHEPDDPDAEKQFKMLLTVAAKMRKGEIQTESSIVLFSADGLRWKSASELTFKDGVLDENSLVLPHVYFEQGGLYRWKGVYHLSGQQFDWWKNDGNRVGRVMKIFRSPDLLNWDPAMAYSFRRDDLGDQALAPGSREEAHIASSVWHRNNVLLGVYGLWHGAEKWEDRSMDLGFMFSNDGIHFREPVRDYVFIKRGGTGDWDEGGLLQGQGFINIKDSTYIWYGSWDMTKLNYPPRGGVGLVTFRRDGFAYLQAKDTKRESHFITRTIEQHELKSDHISLHINAEGATNLLPIRVELVDNSGIPIPEYSGNNAALITGDGTYQEVKWPGTKPPIKRDFAIRVSYAANNAMRFYALYLDQNME